jgi:hypothetical protein
LDPIITSIVTAVSVGAAAGLKEEATQAVKDAYNGFKTLLTGKYKTAGSSLAVLEERPASEPRRAALAEVLQDAGAQRDSDLATHAADLIAVVSRADPDVARVLGVDLKDVEAAVITLRKVKASGTTATAVRIQSTNVRGNITIEDVTAEEVSSKNP